METEWKWITMKAGVRWGERFLGGGIKTRSRMKSRLRFHCCTIRLCDTTQRYYNIHNYGNALRKDHVLGWYNALLHTTILKLQCTWHELQYMENRSPARAPKSKSYISFERFCTKILIFVVHARYSQYIKKILLFGGWASTVLHMSLYIF